MYLLGQKALAVISNHKQNTRYMEDLLSLLVYSKGVYYC